MRFISNDADVVAYVLAVEAADGNRLEDGVISAYDSFITGCKTDGIWSALKASCILSGARTLSGALVPLVGAAPTNFNFVSGDYDRETGLISNGTKHLASNRGSMADPQDDQHMSVNVTQVASFSAFRLIINANSAPQTYLMSGTSQQLAARHRTTSTFQNAGQAANTGFKGASRNNAESYYTRSGGTNFTRTQASNTGDGSNILVFGGSNNQFDGRLSFYSIGESIDLALLDSRVSTLMTDLAAAI
jgi:hypothetical protein